MKFLEEVGFETWNSPFDFVSYMDRDPNIGLS